MALQTRILIDGQETYSTCPRELTSRLLTYPANLQFWSLDGLREFLKGTCEVVQAWCQVRLQEDLSEDLKGKYIRVHPGWAIIEYDRYQGNSKNGGQIPG